MKVHYSIVDVFTRERFGGNPVAVIHDASSLDEKVMLSIAREFGFAETTFILSPEGPESTARVRIFTPIEEIPFAGHPNIGTAFVVATEQTAATLLPDRDIVFEELGGPVQVHLISEGGAVAGAQIVAPQALEVLGKVDPALMARCLGLDANSVLKMRLEPCVATVGLPFAFVELEDLAALASIEIDNAAFKQAARIGPPTVDGFSICAFCVESESETEVSLRSRVFSPMGHPFEDPATGSASGALAAVLARNSGHQKQKITLLQGVEMGRPSEISIDINGVDQPPAIKGHCVLFSNGCLSA